MQNTLLIGENLCLVLGLSSDHFITQVMAGERRPGRCFYTCTGLMLAFHSSLGIYYTVIWKFLFWLSQCEKLSLSLFSPPQVHHNATKLPVPPLAGCLVTQMSDNNAKDLVWSLSKVFCTPLYSRLPLPLPL